MQTGGDDDINILIVVDVQNCFIQGGSLGSPDDNHLANSIEQTNQIVELIDKNELIIFTRDFHPKGHKSFTEQIGLFPEQKGLFPPHCRNNDASCYRLFDPINRTGRTNKPTTLKTVIDTKNTLLGPLNFDDKYYKLPIIGTDISYLFLSTKYKNEILDLITKPKPIGLIKNNHKSAPKISQINYELEIDQDKDKHFYQLTKGEYCNYESYSAFNYHLNYEKGANQSEDIACDKEYSTGLCEFIEHFIREKNYAGKIPKITVCGLVGNICVMHTVHQGLIMTKLKRENPGMNATLNNYQFLYPNLCDAQFYYSCPGTLWLVDAIAGREIPGYILETATPDMVKDTPEYKGEINGLEIDAKKVLTINETDNLAYTIILNNNTSEEIIIRQKK